jgi:hypothetical protein
MLVIILSEVAAMARGSVKLRDINIAAKLRK